MPPDWASSDELLLSLDPGQGRRAGLEGAIRDAIRDGRLGEGDPLPSTRALARDLGLARGTVAEAYAQLAAEGYLRSRPGAATRIASAAGAAPRRPTAERTGPAPERPRLSLRVGEPDVGAFPRREWARSLRHAVTTAADDALRLGDPRGSAPLRHALAGHVARTRGALVDPERVVVCAGFAHALAIVCASTRRAGATAIALEDPGVRQHRSIAGHGGLRVAPLPVDDAGAVVGELPDAQLAVVTPAHQFPLGATLSPARRHALLARARERDALLVEDDYDGEFRYDRHPVGALQGLAPDRVVYAGTASKTLAPALRLAWLVLPPALLEPALAAKADLGASPSTLDQLALADLLRRGAYERHLRRMRQRYKRRRDLLLRALAAAAPDLPIRGIAAGLHLTVELPDHDAELDLLQRARERSLELDGLTPFWHDPRRARAGLVLNYATPPEHAYAQAVAAVEAVLSGSSRPGA
jgi:GntR family transcriptional regulator / MocR family aminotransferase